MKRSWLQTLGFYNDKYYYSLTNLDIPHLPIFCSIYLGQWKFPIFLPVQ